LSREIASPLAGKRIFITGHTGFSGSWVSLWLEHLGAKVYGYALAPETSPSLFVELGLERSLVHTVGDIRDLPKLKRAMAEAEPDLVLHLAAQPLVRRSYREPVETFEVNVQGTVNVLESALSVPSVRGVLCITTDKIYENNGAGKAFTESDRLGGSDPYSASKAAAEIAIGSYRTSYFEPACIGLAVARGGNIIGGGDWSEDRLVPDFMRASQYGGSLTIRYPAATRPWQHVLALADGYITILAGLVDDRSQYSRAFNLGPADEAVLTVEGVLARLGAVVPGVEIIQEEASLYEAGQLALDSSLARSVFDWQPTWSTAEAIEQTALWYQRFFSGEDARRLCLEQIESWQSGDFGGGKA